MPSRGKRIVSMDDTPPGQALARVLRSIAGATPDPDNDEGPLAHLSRRLCLPLRIDLLALDREVDPPARSAEA